MKRGTFFCTGIGIMLWLLAADGQTPPAPARIPAGSITPLSATLRTSDVINHLEKAIAWYRHVETAVQSADASVDILLRDNAHQNALHALQLSFQFARADAAFRASLRESQSTVPGEAPAAARNLDDAAARAADRVSRLQGQITALNNSPGSGSPRNRASVAEQRQELQSELELAQEIQKTVLSMVSFAGANTSSSTTAKAGFSGQINELQRSVPEAATVVATRKGAASGADGSDAKDKSATQPKASPMAGAALPNGTVPSLHPESEGLIGLIGTVFTTVRGEEAVDNLLGETDALSANIDQLKSPLVTQLRSAIKQSEDITSAAASESADQLGAGQKQISTLTSQFRRLSTVVVPLGEEQILVQDLRGSLVEWRALTNQEKNAAARYLFVRLGMLLFAIAALVVCSELWKRATLRYVLDVRRRRQLLVVRRIVVSLVFFSDPGCRICDSVRFRGHVRGIPDSGPRGGFAERDPRGDRVLLPDRKVRSSRGGSGHHQRCDRRCNRIGIGKDLPDGIGGRGR